MGPGNNPQRNSKFDIIAVVDDKILHDHDINYRFRVCHSHSSSTKIKQTKNLETRAKKTSLETYF